MGIKLFLSLLGLLLLTGCAAWGFASLPGTTPTPPATTVTSSPTRQPTNTARPAGAAARIVPTSTPAACVVTTEGEVLNVRKSPSMEAEIISGLMPGQRVTVITWGDAWHKITAGQLTGYVFADYCEATK